MGVQDFGAGCGAGAVVEEGGEEAAVVWSGREDAASAPVGVL